MDGLLWLPIALGLLLLYPAPPGLSGGALVAEREATYVLGIVELLPPGVKGLLLTAMLAALASTLDTHLNWGAAYWTNDIYARFIAPRSGRAPQARTLVRVSRGSHLLLLALAFAVMTQLASIRAAWEASLLLGAGVGVVLVLRWIWWRLNAWGEVGALAASALLVPATLAFVAEENALARRLQCRLLRGAKVEPLGSPTISGHYTSGTLLERLRAALAADGADPERPGLEALAPYDHFHGRGLEATRELADALTIGATDHLLDIGSGIGGPARYFAERFGCRVTGIDLTAEFCAVGRRLTALLGLSERVVLEEGDALSMPFAGATFDGAYSMNVSMNIADKAAFYREILRVLRPGGWLVLSEYARGAGPDPEYPAPWAASAEASFLANPEATRRGLEAAGFEVVSLKDTLAAALEYGARSRAMAERGEKPPHRAVQLIHGEGAKAMMANTGRALKDGGIVPIEVLARRTG